MAHTKSAKSLSNTRAATAALRVVDLILGVVVLGPCMTGRHQTQAVSDVCILVPSEYITSAYAVLNKHFVLLCNDGSINITQTRNKTGVKKY